MGKYCYVFKLNHSRIVGIDSDNDELRDSKVLGLYSSRSEAYSAQERFRLLNGFRDFPNDFSIEKRRVNLDSSVAKLTSGMKIYLLTNEFSQEEYDWVTDLGLFTSFEEVNETISRSCSRVYRKKKYLNDRDNYIIGVLNLDRDNIFWDEGFEYD